MAPTWSSTKKGYENLWAKAKIARPGAVAKQVARILKNKDVYLKAEELTGVPWVLVACLHSRESNLSFDGILHSGEEIIGKGTKSTVLVPKGVGPFDTWEASAKDALESKDLHLVTLWTVGRMLFEAERYNGWGYTYKGINSPYVWAGSSLEQPGKYVADHVFDRNAIDKQLGVAAILMGLANADDSVKALLGGVSARPTISDSKGWSWPSWGGDAPTPTIDLPAIPKPERPPGHVPGNQGEWVWQPMHQPDTKPIPDMPGNTVSIGDHLRAIAVLMDVEEVSIAATICKK